MVVNIDIDKLYNVIKFDKRIHDEILKKGMNIKRLNKKERNLSDIVEIVCI